MTAQPAGRLFSLPLQSARLFDGLDISISLYQT